MAHVLEFLLFLHKDKELGYSALNSARSALSAIIQIDGQPIGKNYYVCKFLSAAFNERPALPRNNVVWDPDLVLKLLKSWSPVAKISMERLTQKLLVLMLLISGQRGQSIHLLDIRNMDLSFSMAKFTIGDVVKQTRPGHHLSQIVFKGYAPDRRLCVVTVLKEYLARTLEVRGKIHSLFVTMTKPTKAASRDTIRRWTKKTLSEAGVNMKMFKPHSTRSAATSSAKAKLPLKTILDTVGWSSESTFTKYYDKKVVKLGQIGDAILP